MPMQVLIQDVSVRHVNGWELSGLRNVLWAGKETEMDALLKMVLECLVCET
jgi:hypothetical protein